MQWNIRFGTDQMKYFIRFELKARDSEKMITTIILKQTNKKLFFRFKEKPLLQY